MASGGFAALLAASVPCFAQASGDNPCRPVRGWADGGGPSVPGGEWGRLPGGRVEPEGDGPRQLFAYSNLAKGVAAHQPAGSISTRLLPESVT
jgi:hypothetical protein